MKKQSICKQCGKEFTYETCVSAGVFCGKKCWLQNLKEQYKEIKCKQCGKIFSVIPSSKQQFCNYKCAAKWLKGENHHAYNIEERKRICKNCGKEFTVDYKNCPQMFCSNECQGLALSKEKHWAWKGGPSTYTCDFCGKEYEDYKYKENEEHHFCSRNCMHKYFSGENSPRWIDGLNRLYPNEFNNDLKETVRERDDRVCQICGMPEKNFHCNLHIHHIDKDKFNLKEDNLISLCPHCHSKVHADKDFERKYLCEKGHNKKETINV